MEATAADTDTPIANANGKPADAAPGLGPIRRRSLHEGMIVMLRELIVSGKLAPGSKVPEKELCDRYGVSRTPLREALKVLAIEGLVTLEANRGSWVTQITRAELDEFFPVMGALEALAGELACRNISDDEIARVRALHDEMVGHYRAGRLKDYFAVNEAIHEAILDAARNGTLAVQYRSLASRVRRARYVANMTAARWAQATGEHEEIITALEARDGVALAAILKQHLGNKLVTVCDWLDRDTADQAVADGAPET